MATLTPPKDLAEWRVFSSVAEHVLIDNDNGNVCVFSDEHTALYVLTACKAHGPMVEALQAVIVPGNLEYARRDIITKARAALALAEPKP